MIVGGSIAYPQLMYRVIWAKAWQKVGGGQYNASKFSPLGIRYAGIENVLICHKDKDYIFLALLDRKKDEVDRLEPSWIW